MCVCVLYICVLSITYYLLYVVSLLKANRTCDFTCHSTQKGCVLERAWGEEYGSSASLVDLRSLMHLVALVVQSAILVFNDFLVHLQMRNKPIPPLPPPTKIKPQTNTDRSNRSRMRPGLSCTSLAPELDRELVLAFQASTPPESYLMPKTQEGGACDLSWISGNCSPWSSFLRAELCNHTQKKTVLGKECPASAYRWAWEAQVRCYI